MTKKKYQLTLQNYKKTIREYNEQLYANKFDHLEEMNNFLKIYSPPRMNKEEEDHLKKPINRNEIKYVI